MRIKSNFLLLCFHVGNLRFHVETSCGGDARKFSCVLKPFVTSRSWVVYDKSTRVSRIKLDKRNALKHVALWTALHQHSPSLVFTRSVVTAALKQLVVQFGMSQDSSKDYVETMTNRLQDLCRTMKES